MARALIDLDAFVKRQLITKARLTNIRKRLVQFGFDRDVLNLLSLTEDNRNDICVSHLVIRGSWGIANSVPSEETQTQSYMLKGVWIYERVIFACCAKWVSSSLTIVSREFLCYLREMEMSWLMYDISSLQIFCCKEKSKLSYSKNTNLWNYKLKIVWFVMVILVL